jgi:hypothetical protein
MRSGGLIFLRLLKLNYNTSVLEPSGSLLTVLVLYLVLHRELVCGHSRLYSSRRWENKVKTPGAGKNMVEEAVQTPLHPSQGSCLLPNNA